MKEIYSLDILRQEKERNPELGWIFEKAGEATHFKYALMRRNRLSICALTTMAFTHGIQYIQLERVPKTITPDDLRYLSLNRKYWHSRWEEPRNCTSNMLSYFLNLGEASWIILQNEIVNRSHVIGCIKIKNRSDYAVWDTRATPEAAKEFGLKQKSHFGIVDVDDIMTRVIHWQDPKAPLQIACFTFK